MTENSFYWPGTSLTDAGPYEARTMWANLGQVGRAGNAESDSTLYNIGVFYSVANQLEPTINGGNIDVDTGASLVDGAYHENNNPVTIGIPATTIGGETRIDLIVVRKNFSDLATYTPTISGTPTVGPNEARITVINGVQAVGPSDPTVVQDTTRATYWDIPLAYVTVDSLGNLTNLRDLREYVDAETKYRFIKAQTGNNLTDVTQLNLIQYTNGAIVTTMSVIETPDNKDCIITADVEVPTDFISSMYMSSVVVEEFPGDAFVGLSVGAGTDGEAYNVHSQSTGFTAVTIGGVNNQYQFIKRTLITLPINSLDILHFTVQRDATNINDTINDVLAFSGFWIEYFGWKK